MVTIEKCEFLLKDTASKNISQLDNISVLTKNARGNDKAECISKLWWANEVNNKLQNWKIEWFSLQDFEDDEIQTNNGEMGHFAASTQADLWNNLLDQSWSIQNTIIHYLYNIGIILLVIIVSSFVLRFLKVFLKYSYAFFNYRRLIFLKVLQPRWDWKSDREQEKEIAKDMKEKIWRMSQVLWNLHKMNEVSTYEKFMQTMFWKHKLVFIYQYEKGQFSCIIGTYPEYQNMVESAIASQYASSSIERVSKPKFFKKKFSDIQVFETQKDPLYTIKLYKNIPDDPINNIIDSMWKVSADDTVSIVLVAKPELSNFNSRRQIAADRLYKNLDIYEVKRRHWKNLLNPLKILEFLLKWPSDKLVSSKNEEEKVTMVRMVKAKEDSRNAMWEEAANPTFCCTISIIASSDDKTKPTDILNNLESAYNVYSDEYSNSLQSSNVKHDIFGWFYIPLWKSAVNMFVTWFFSKYCYFSTNELCSLYHFPDWLYNRSPAIEWMQYKVVAPPSNLPSFAEEWRNGKIISWILAEKYKKWNLSAILDEYPNHWAVWSRKEPEEKFKLLSKCSDKEKKAHNIFSKKGVMWTKIIEKHEEMKLLSECTPEEKLQNDIVDNDWILSLKLRDENDQIYTKNFDECNSEEKDDHNIIEENWQIYLKLIVDKEVEKLLSECTEEEKLQNDIVEKDWELNLKFVHEKDVKWYKIYKWWVLLWVNIYRNVYSPVYIKRDDRTRHHYCIWKSWTWKSVFLQTIARQDVWNGDWICLIDPHGDLAEDMLAYIPKERAKDVVYFEAWDEERPMWLNLYEIDNLDQADRTVNDATEIFLKMFGPEIFGPRIQEYFKYWSLTLLEDFEDRPTLLDVTRLFTDDWFREFKLKKVTNAVVRNRWEKTYNSMWDREKQEIIPYFSSKFVSFNTNRLIRNIIWQTKSAFKFDDIMNNQKILLINLSKGKIWELNAQLLWMIIVSKVYNSAMARASIPEKDRKDFYLYVDEFQNFVSWTFADILSEARKYRLGLIMAHQYIAQLDTWKSWWEWWKSDVKAAVFGNVGTMQSFKVGAPDAEFLEKEYSPVLSWQDIVWIANYKSYIKLNIDNATTRVFSMNSIYTKDYQNKKMPPILKEYSAKKYGRRREFVDAETRARLWLSIEDEDLTQI